MNTLKKMKFQKRILTTSVLVGLLMSINAYASDKNIGDLSIYKAAEAGSATVTMMLDTSGSMGVVPEYDSIYEDYKVYCGQNYSTNYQDYEKSINLTDKNGSVIDTLSYTLSGCEINYKSGKKYRYDRLSRLKMAMIPLFADGSLLSSKYKIGLGNYSANGAGKAGQIIIPAQPLTIEHRRQLINKIDALTAKGGTPSAHAYAEAGAYMMGTKTSDSVYDTRYTVKGYIEYSNSTYILNKCTRNFSTLDNNVYRCYFSETVQTSGNKDALDLSLIGEYNYEANGSGKTKKVFYDKKTGWWASDSYSGLGYSDSSTINQNSGEYISPINDGQCDGYGIFFLTDGAPNGVYGNSAAELMETSLDIKNVFNVNGDDCTGSTLTSTSGVGGGGWKCMAQYSKKLASPSNPSRKEIKTAAVGFGSVFKPEGGLPTKTIKVEGSNDELIDKTIVDCSKLSSDNAKNLCYLSEFRGIDKDGNQTGQYGQGGFTATSDPVELKQSFVDFADSLFQIISTAPSGTITVPVDPLSTTNIQPFAYLPMLEPKVDEQSSIWPGNLKKFHVDQGTLFGQNNKRLYVSPPNSDAFPYALNEETKDIWMGSDADNIVKGKVKNNGIHTGGVYARLRAPDSINPYSVRNVYVEDIISAGATETRLIQVGVSAAGDLVGFDQLISNVYTPVAMAYLLNYLGYNVSVEEGRYATMNRTEVLADLQSQLTPIVDETKVLGGVVHSKPALVSYGGEFNASDKDTVNNSTGAAGSDGIVDSDAGQIANDESRREDHIMFGSMDGALHLVDAESGEEDFAVIPLTMMKSQLVALKKQSVKPAIGKPFFGVDAPWTSKIDYRFNLTGNGSLESTSVRVYGGLRMGGIGLYGMDFTNRNNPNMLFSIKRGTGGAFRRLGQIWSEPLFAKIKTGTEADDVREVIIFGGGYDMCYESPTFTLLANGGNSETDDCNLKSAAYGNAVYMVDANTGQKIWSWSGSNDGDANNTTIADMRHSVVGGITGLDRNDNGTLDHFYFADLGGQIFRVDLQEGVTGANMSHRAVEIFDANEDITIANHIPYRFYERPIVSFHDNNAETFATINIASGDRSSPLFDGRTIEDANRVYGIFDRDIAQQGIFGNINRISEDMDTGDLTELPFGSRSRTALVDDMRDGIYSNVLQRTLYTTNGWYYPLTRFDSYGNVEDLKSMGEGIAKGGFYYMTVYSPDVQYGNTDSCSAKIVGGSERQLYCLPYGICNQTDDDGNRLSENGTGGYTRAGAGIQEIVLGPLNSNKRTTRVLIGNQTISEQVDEKNRNDEGQSPDGYNNLFVIPVNDNDNNDGNDGDGNDGDGNDDSGKTTNPELSKGDKTAPAPVFEEGFKLITERWYELLND